MPPRLKQVLPSIIHPDQTRYLKGRYIGENVRLLFDAIEHAEENEIPGLLFFADFEKAFDTLNYNFIMQALNFFKFGNDLKQWISVFYQDCTGCVINNCYASPFFNICRGVRQGCPLFPYLFIICIELLAVAIRNDPNLKGISILNCDVEKEIKISLYADDTTLLLPGKEEVLRQAIGIFNKFRISSGLTLNLSKCEVLRIGSLRNSNAPLCSELNLRWANHNVSALGVVFSTNQNTIKKLNYEPQLEKIQNVSNMWRDRDLSLIGKIVVLKALAISKLVFLFSSLLNPDENFFCRLKKILQCFLSNNKPPTIKYSIFANETEQGGLRLPDPKCFCESLKLKWVKKIINEDASCIWKILIENQLEFVGGNLIWQCSFNDKDYLLLKIKSRFLLDVLVAWSHFRFQYGDKGCSLNENEVMWNNSTIKINGVSVF